jgi:uncharacterized membrane protein
VFPLGLFISAAVFDVVYLSTGNEMFTSVSFWNIAVGVAGGLLAAVFGLIDWLAIPAGTRAKRLGLLHGLGNVVVVGLFALSLWFRLTNAYVPPAVALVLSFCAVGIGAVTGWLGGELVDRLGVGIDDGAHLDAPSSLHTDRVPMGTRRPA